MNIIQQITKALNKAIEVQNAEMIRALSSAYQRVKSVETYSSQKEEKHIGAYSNYIQEKL